MKTRLPFRSSSELTGSFVAKWHGFQAPAVTLKLAELASERGAEIILFSDKWISPISQLADVTFSNQIAAPSAWDSNIATMLMSEIIITEVQERNWETAKGRMQVLEELFGRAKFFRKFKGLAKNFCLLQS
ncbi:MAG: SIS domain-containing protein [Pseudomonadota bacterium]